MYYAIKHTRGRQTNGGQKVVRFAQKKARDEWASGGPEHLDANGYREAVTRDHELVLKIKSEAKQGWPEKHNPLVDTAHDLLASRFAALVERRPGTLPELADALGVSRSYITDRQRGRRDVRPLDVLALERLLDDPPEKHN